MGMRIGIFGGSFNPIHFGHVRLARKLLALTGLDEVWFVVSPQNPLKRQNELLDDQVRLEMVQAALRREKHMKASDVEFRLPKPSYTWNTLEMLKQEHPGDEFTLLIGGDNWERFHLWYRAEDIRNNYPIVVYPRSGSTTNTSPNPSEGEGIGNQKPDKKVVDQMDVGSDGISSAAKVTTLPSFGGVGGGLGGGFPLINISSTMVRQRVREGRPIDRLVPRPVARIIKERGLYL